ncbi:MAG: hypothetical protein KAT05_16175 [Spirochaetes bacterium]|nr:hypothetical protein [Spirochaetota bacterium]
MVSIDYSFEILRFGLGFIGTLTYFMCIKYNFLNFELDDPEKNSNAITNNYIALGFFCLVGGLVPIMMDIRLFFGCFVQGFILRATLSSFYSAVESKKSTSGGS